MRALFIGDIVGQPGKHACSQIIPRLISERELDVVVANGENIAGGSGITPQLFAKLRHYGVDAVTLGDHIYKRREAFSILESSERIVKPANLSPEAVGREVAIVTGRLGHRFAVFSLLGRQFMNMRSDCPFHAAERVLASIPPDIKLIFVDVHAETTSEKIALGWFLDGRVTAVYGTHTHVQTADERILPKGTAYITDLGMTGPHDSVLGRDRQNVVQALLTGMPFPYNVASGDVRLCGAIVDADSQSGQAIMIERVNMAESSPLPSEVDEPAGAHER